MHPGKPPSQRRDWKGDWRDRLRETTQALATKMRTTFGFDGPSSRRFLIESARLALGESSTEDLQNSEVSDEGDGAIAVTAVAFRIILDGDGIDRHSPVVAESFMAVVQKALGDMTPG